MKVKDLARYSILLAIAFIFSYIEHLVTIPFLFPGAKLGLANAVGLIVLYYYGPKEYALIGFLRVLLVALLRTGIGSIAFVLSLSGWFVSTLFVLLIYSFKKVSIYGLSMSSSVMHGVGQIIMVVAIYSLPEMINYLPILMVSGLISGNVLALLCSELFKKLDKVMR